MHLPSSRVSLPTMRRYIHPPAATSISLPPHMKLLVFGSTQSSLLISTISSLSASLCPLFPHLLHKFPPTLTANYTLLKSIRFHTNLTYGYLCLISLFSTFHSIPFHWHFPIPDPTLPINNPTKASTPLEKHNVHRKPTKSTYNNLEFNHKLLILS